MWLKNHPLFELVSASTQISIVADNAKSHAVQQNSTPVRAPSPPCRWQSSPDSPLKPPVASLKRSASVPAIPSLHRLVMVSPVRRGSLDLPLPSYTKARHNNNTYAASKLLSEYLRLSTETLSLLNLEDDKGDKVRGRASPPPKDASLLSNVKKPVRRKSLDGSSTTAC